MTLPRDEVVKGLLVELQDFGELVRSLSADDLSQPSRCAGWTAGDVAAHVVGSIADITQGRIEGQGTPEVTDRQVGERRGRSAAQLADELAEATALAPSLLAVFDDEAWEAPAPGGYDFSLGEAVEALWYDAYVHADDIRAACGRASETGDGLRASVHHVATLLARNGWGPATLALDGLDQIEVGTGGGRTVEGDPLAFLLAATGRSDPQTVGLDESVNVYRTA